MKNFSRIDADSRIDVSSVGGVYRWYRFKERSMKSMEEISPFRVDQRIYILKFYERFELLDEYDKVCNCCFAHKRMIFGSELVYFNIPILCYNTHKKPRRCDPISRARVFMGYKQDYYKSFSQKRLEDGSISNVSFRIVNR